MRNNPASLRRGYEAPLIIRGSKQGKTEIKNAGVAGD